MIDWLNPSDDVLEARRIGYQEGFIEGEQHGIELQTQNDRAQIREAALEEAARGVEFDGRLCLACATDAGRAIRALKTKPKQGGTDR